MTSIEWLRIKMATSSPKEMVENINVWFEQAKEMEKQQIKDAYTIPNILKDDFETYYDETYKKNNL